MTKMCVCYWIVGLDNKTQAPAVAFDLHASNGDVIKSDSHTLTAGCDVQRDALICANDFARRNGAQSVSYDSDSTAAFSDC